MNARIEDVLSRVQKAKRTAGGYVACCPAHEDHRPSLSITAVDDETVLVNCHAGCTFEAVAAALNLPTTKPRTGGMDISETYDYQDADGHLVYQVVRMHPKDFRQRKPDGHGGWTWKLEGVEPLPYRLPEVKAAVEAGRRVFVVEGERDVHTLEAFGMVATCNSGGAGKWYPSCTAALRGAHVVIVPDNDEAGEKHAAVVEAAIGELAASVVVCRLPDLPPKGDVTDWVRAGGTADELKAIVKAGGVQPTRPFTLLDAVRDVARFKDAAMPPGIDYPWRSVNRKTRGMRPGWFCIIAGYPGSGKTAAALEIIFAAAKRGKRILLNSLEMNAEEVALRLVQRWGLDTERLYDGGMTDEDRDAFDNAANFPYYGNVDFISERSLSGLESTIAERRPDLVVVDYIGVMDMGRDNAQEGTTRLSRAMKGMAREYEVPMLVLSQLSRPADKQKVSAPTMFDLRASGALEADADQIIIVFRDDTNDDRDSTSEGRFIIAKSRHAKAGKPVKFSFNGARQTFLEIDQGHERAREQGWSVHDGGQS